MKAIKIDNIEKKRAKLALIGIFFLVVPVVIFMSGIKSKHVDVNIDVVNGFAVIDNYEGISDVVHSLHGEWKVAEGVYIKNEENLGILEDSNLIGLRDLPETKLNEVRSTRTYILDLEFTEEINQSSRLAIAIPFLSDDVQIFLNGNMLQEYEPFESWIGTDIELKIFLLRDYIINDQELQQLVISVNESGDNYGLYKREILISDIASIYERLQVQDGLQNLLVGMMIICILMGWINMLILPGHNMLTSMTMFDSTLMLYFFFEVCRLPVHTYTYFFDGQFGEKVIRGIVLSLFCLTGFWGNRISRDIFDPNIEVNKNQDMLIGRLWLFGAVINLLFPQYYGAEAIIVTLLFYTFTMDLLIKKILHCKKQGKYTRVMKIQAYKAIYVGGLLGYDIITTNLYPRNNIVLIVGYSIFFFLEFLMRANVQKETFDLTKLAKEDLERKVKERTDKLNQANKNLQQLMHIDPLTNAFNRLYFESKLLEEIEKKQELEKYHLCLFDLDNFKYINDTYGHHIGDEQLIEAVEAVKNVIKENGVISRIGGEEFMILFRNMADLSVLTMVDNIRLELEKISSREGRTTGSFGVTKYRSDDTKKTVFIRVDQCLYHAKNNGKNCVVYEFDERKIYDATVKGI